MNGFWHCFSLGMYRNGDAILLWWSQWLLWASRLELWGVCRKLPPEVGSVSPSNDGTKNIWWEGIISSKQHSFQVMLFFQISRNEWILFWSYLLVWKFRFLYFLTFIHSNGNLDPWSTGGVLWNVSDSVVSVIIPEGAHHLDLRGSNPNDPESVIDARRVEKEFIKTWINEYRSAHNLIGNDIKNNNTFEVEEPHL